MIPMPGWLQPLSQSRLLEEARANLRHALRNKLGAVRNATFYIRKKVEKTSLPTDEPRVATFFNLIESELEQATQLVEFRAATEGVVPAADVRTAIERLLASVEVPQGRAVELSPGAPCPLEVAPEEVGLAVFHLVVNALEAGARRVTVAVARESDTVSLVVSDDGDGLSEETASRAFEAFFSTRPGHLGIGLTIVKRLATGWGGTVELSSLERGTRVTLRIPPREPSPT